MAPPSGRPGKNGRRRSVEEEASAPSGTGKRHARVQRHKEGLSTKSSQAGGDADALVTKHSADSIPMAATPTELFQKNTTFAKLGLSRWLADSCEKMGMLYPTDIQAMTIPPILAGKNVAGNSKTGSGKTACYCLPVLHHLSKDPYGVFALVLTPVRELAFQFAENFRALGKGIGVEVCEVVGGREMMHQSNMIAERKHVIVASPGRLADLLRGDPELARAFRRLRILVLDEADRLLTPTFEEPLAEILAAMPKTRQTVLFSATITSSIEKLKLKFSGGSSGTELVFLDANPKDETLELMTQQYVFVPRTIQVCYLHYLLKCHFEDSSVMVFAPTIDLCQLLTTMLELLDFPVTGLHSLQSQRKRQISLSKFRGGRAKILVATDVAGRGLDIPKVAVVINFGLPQNTDDYVHRAGRTARAGRPGLVVSLITERDVAKVHAVEQRIGRGLELRPTVEGDALKLLSKTTKTRQKAELLLSEVGFEERVEEHRAERKQTKKQDAKGKRKADDAAEGEGPSDAAGAATSEGGESAVPGDVPARRQKRVGKKQIRADAEGS